jgi:radical SAM protein with 4Fe4S-binding SPASM domain
MSLFEKLNQKAFDLGLPLNVHMDVTYRCNERCQHCYLDHDDHGEMTTEEIRGVLCQLQEAGVFFLTLSGGEPLVRRDCFEIIEYARSLKFHVKLKSNAVLITSKQAARLRSLGVGEVQVSVYSHRPEIHDAITRLPGSLARTLAGIAQLTSEGIKVTLANVLMKGNAQDSEEVHILAEQIGAQYTLDPTITPMLSGDTSVLDLRLPSNELNELFHKSKLVGDVQAFCAPPPAVDEDVLDGYPCSAGHTACYISPYGDLFPCVQFPLTCGNLRHQSFSEIWKDSPQLKEVRSIRARHLTTCSSCGHLGSCTRCPGLAFMEGDMRGPSSADCEKSYVRTGIVSAGMIARQSASANLVQIAPLNFRSESFHGVA